MLSFLERNLWLSLALLAMLVVLLLASLSRLGGGLPALKPLKDRAPAIHRRLLEEKVEEWFAVTALARPTNITSATDPFYTLHFQPPPPPRTRRIELLYQGCLIPSSGAPRAYVKVGENSLVLTNGAVVIADHAIKAIALRTLTLTNRAGLTNLLEFNVKKALDVPSS